MRLKENKVKKREKRIVIYALSGLFMFSVLGLLSDRPELFGAVLGCGVVWLLNLLLFNLTSYPVLYQKYKRGTFKTFPLIQLGIVIISLIIVLIVLWSFLLIHHKLINL